MREDGIPQFTVDAHRPVRDFDVFGISFSTELGYTNMINALDLAGIPLHAVDRGDEDLDRAGRRPRGVQPRADRGLPRRCGSRRRRGGRARDLAEVVRDWKSEVALGGRDELLRSLAVSGNIYVPKFYDVVYNQDGSIEAVVPNRPGIPYRVRKHADGPRRLALPAAAGPARRDRPRAVLGRDLPRLHPRLPLLPGRHDHPPEVRERLIETIGAMVENGIRKSGFEEVGLLSLSSADHTEIAEVAKGLADRYEGTNVSLSLPSTRVDAFNISLANEFSRNGRRSGLTFAPEGGSERLRRVINKMVTEKDLIRTVAAAYSHGWRQVKLYFMVGLPTETDDDVLQIADLARKVIAKGREVSGRNDIRCTVSIGGFVPAAHAVPVGLAARPRDHRRAAEEAARHGPRGQEVRPGDRLPLPRRQARHHRGIPCPAATA